MNAVTITDRFGRPMSAEPRPRALALAGNRNQPYDASDRDGDHTTDWTPYLWSPDVEAQYRDLIVARIRDLVRNDGWASGGITRILDNVIGARFRPVSKPDWRALRAITGAKGYDAAWAAEYASWAEANYRTWAQDLGRWCDSTRSMTVSQMMRVGFRHKIVDGDAIAVMPWLPHRVAPGKARYATAVTLVDPDRLSNPNLAFDTDTLRGGVELDEYRAACAYHFRRAHPGAWYSAADSVTWDRYERETDWGRPIVIHDFDSERADEHRGNGGILRPVLVRLKALAKYDGAELDAAILNAVFGAYIESPFDHDMVSDAMGSSELGSYQAGRAAFHEDRRIVAGGVRFATLYPGEKVNFLKSERPNANYAGFEKAVLRNAAGAMGMSAQQLSQDWSDVNYSSARAALLESWKTMTRRRDDFASGFSQPMFGTWMEEAFEVDDPPLPAGAAEFIECRTAYANADWMGPGRGWVDPVAEKEGAVLGMEASLSTLQQECAEQGLDYEEVLLQRRRELDLFAQLELPPPSWAQTQTFKDQGGKGQSRTAVVSREGMGGKPEGNR